MEDLLIDQKSQSYACNGDTYAAKNDERYQLTPIMPDISRVLDDDLETVAALNRFHESHDGFPCLHFGPHSVFQAQHPQTEQEDRQVDVGDGNGASEKEVTAGFLCKSEWRMRKHHHNAT